MFKSATSRKSTRSVAYNGKKKTLARCGETQISRFCETLHKKLQGYYLLRVVFVCLPGTQNPVRGNTCSITKITFNRLTDT